MTRVSVPLAAGAPLVEALFLARPNQFVIDAQLEGRTVRAHIADRGRLRGVLQRGTRLLLAERTEIGRRTGYQVVAAYAQNDLVSLDTHLPNKLIQAALSARALPQFNRYTQFFPEQTIGKHRFDFRLVDDLATCVLEVKSVTQVHTNLAQFPDAPTERGRAHLEALTNLARNGQRASLIFVVQRSIGRALVPNSEIDPAFAQALRHALMYGVEVYAYRCPVTPTGLILGKELPVYMSAAAVPAHV